MPNDVSIPDKVAYINSGLLFIDTISCIDDFYPSGNTLELFSMINETKQKIDSIVEILQLLVDDGSTDSLKSEVDNSSSGQSYDVYQDLLNASPFLSDTVIMSSVEKEEVLQNAMIRDIMVANPHSTKNEEILDAIDERNDPMPDSMWVEILQGMDTVGAMERLIDELSGWIQRKDLYFNALSELLIMDTIHLWVPDSIIFLFDSDEQLLSKYLLVQYYLNHLDFSEATDVLQNIPQQFVLTNRQEFVHEQYLDLINLFSDLMDDTLGFQVPDSLQILTLVELSGLDYDCPGTWARNILIASGIIEYQEPIISETSLKSSRKDKYHWTNSRTISSSLNVFPNPAKEYMIVEYKKGGLNNQADLFLLDSKGTIKKKYRLSKSESQIVIPTSDLPSGSYFLQLRIDGSIKETRKAIIIR